MKNSTTTSVIKGLTLTIAMVVAGSAHSAGYLKIGDIKGESTRTAPTAPTAVPDQQQVDSGNGAKTAMLLPAVQSAREAAKRTESEKRKSKIEASYKVEKGQP